MIGGENLDRVNEVETTIYQHLSDLKLPFYFFNTRLYAVYTSELTREEIFNRLVYLINSYSPVSLDSDYDLLGVINFDHENSLGYWTASFNNWLNGVSR
ncbi:hypothetical protein [Paenibacillus sp. N3.4]|uniref:hypothetical protein n=1 Tax=Paenibacillus sp. N3.4 TaxID=2603222 RepID=UPI00164FE496|nr:hypothetical protein [Paenibacillus sp. N3.4]